MVARLNQRLAPYPECKALVMDGEALTFEDSTFDAAFSVLSTTLFANWSAGLDEAVRVVRPGGWLGIVHWANPEGAGIFTILLRALNQLPLPTGSPDAPKLTALMSAHELRAALEARSCEVKEVERLDAPSPLPPPESFMDTLDPIYRAFPTYRLLDETMRDELRVLLTLEARRWVEEDVPAVAQLTSTWRSHGALADAIRVEDDATSLGEVRSSTRSVHCPAEKRPPRPETESMPDQIEQTLRSLGGQLPGRVSRPGGDGYAAATAIWAKPVGPMPRAVVHCRTTDDVQSAIRAARDCGLPLSVRGGGHHWAGRALCAGIVIDLSAMNGSISAP
jgi:SAM-dependent methyltransferase